jgi:hypothetical protein
MAAIAYRRWVSFSRRNKVKGPTEVQRVSDLAKGLQAHFEPKFSYTPRSEWIYIAQVLAAILSKQSMEKKKL